MKWISRIELNLFLQQTDGFKNGGKLLFDKSYTEIRVKIKENMDGVINNKISNKLYPKN